MKRLIILLILLMIPTVSGYTADSYTEVISTLSGDYTADAYTEVISILDETTDNLISCTTLNITNTVYTLGSNITSTGTCFTIGANNITLDGAGYTIEYATTTIGYGLNNSEGYDNLTIKNINFIHSNATVDSSYAIYTISMIDSLIYNNTFNVLGDANGGVIYLSSSDYNNISYNTITANGESLDGLYLLSSDNNIINSNQITTTESSSKGIRLWGSTYNNITSNIITATNSGLWLFSSSNWNRFINNTVIGNYGVYLNGENNIFINGSITAISTNDYYLQSAGTNNNFTDTNFTGLRRISFADSNSWFNYNNDTTGDLWLNTKVSTLSYLNRTLINWSNTSMILNDTASADLTVTYNLTGLLTTTDYNVTNATTSQTIQTDGAGALSVDIALSSGVVTTMSILSLPNTPDINCSFGGDITAIRYRPIIDIDNPPTEVIPLNVTPVGQTDVIPLFTCINNGTLSGQIQLKISTTALNVTDICGITNIYGSSIDLTTAYQNIGSSVVVDNSISVWCKRGYVSHSFVIGSFNYNFTII